MGTEQGNNGIKPSTLYSALGAVFTSMFLVLMASNMADDNWFRVFMMVYLLGMQLYFVAAMIVARRAEKKSGGKPSTEPAPPTDQPRE